MDCGLERGMDIICILGIKWGKRKWATRSRGGLCTYVKNHVQYFSASSCSSHNVTFIYSYDNGWKMTGLDFWSGLLVWCPDPALSWGKG